MADQVKPAGQLAIDETVIADAKLEALLEERAAARDLASEYRRSYVATDVRAKDALKTLEISEDGALRIGRFRVTQRPTKERSVSFTTAPSSRIRIEAVD